MRNLGPWAVLLFVATLAYVIGVRLNEMAMAVVIGVIFGVLASVPASLFLLFAMRRAQERRAAESARREQPTIIITPPVATPPGQLWPYGPTYLPPLEEEEPTRPSSGRRFRVVGEE